MKILIVGKYPPIQGGVSSSTYVSAQRLAKSGHSIDIVTNSKEVESCYRQMLLDEDEVLLTSKNLRVYYTTPITKDCYIPFANPFSTKLFGLATSVIEENRPDLIIGWYYEPYGFIASTLSKFYDIPCLLRHAGSDLGRLSKHCDLRQTYKQMLKQAEFIVTSNSSQTIDELVSLGVNKEKLIFLKGFKFPEYFNKKAEPLNLKSINNSSESWFNNLCIESTIKQNLIFANKKDFDPLKPTLGIFGKVGLTKGSYDLINVLSKLSNEGCEFNFISVSSGNNQALTKYYNSILQDKKLTSKTFFLPALANWRIPNLLSTLDIAFFLERDFPIEFHTPKVPIEILSSGKCLVISNQIVDKNPYHESFVDNKNCIIVDPKDTQSFADRLRSLICDKQFAKRIGTNGRYLYNFIQDTNEDVSTFENIIEQLTARITSANKTISPSEPIQAT